MKAILDQIDKSILASLSDKSVKAYGLCIQVKKGASIQPITIESKIQAAVNDEWDLCYFHRLLNDEVDDNEEFQFGGSTPKMHHQKVRTFVAIKRKLTDEFIDRFINAIPEKLVMEGYKVIDVADGVLENNDQDAVYIAEYGDADYEKHRIPYYIYALEYDVNYIKCVYA